MFKEDNDLAEKCESYAGILGQAVDWVDRNKDVVRTESDSLLKDLRKSARGLRKFGKAARRKMCVGIFGPSQAGKSYLVSALAKGADGKLIADFGNEAQKNMGRQIDFLADINPEGGKESTGLVTRFSLSRHEKMLDEYPVQLQLLSETDVVKILGNTYYADFVHESVPNAEAIKISLADLEKRVSSGAARRVEADDISELRDYFNRNFKSCPRVQTLDNVYWDRAIQLAPKLDGAGRRQLFEIIWDKTPQLTFLYTRLQAAIEKLDHCSEAFCPMSALIPRSTSIIDVETLKGLSQAGGIPLEAMTLTGRKATIDRVELAALTAEIVVVMASKPDDFFDHTDLLDFPGYRSRLKLKEIEKELCNHSSLEIAFLRGKVEYLFQRYTAESELTSMLLCIGPGNMEVNSLPGVVDEWVKITHGQTPDKRNGRPVSLFFVMTKFDMECGFKAGADTAEGYIQRWENRLISALLKPFGNAEESWPRRWDSQRMFSNVFFIRNPNVRSPDLFDYPNECETSKTNDTYVSKLHAGFLGSETFRKHFVSPEASWNAVMLPGDGGITNLREHLRPVCNPELKRGQIEENVRDEMARLVSRLKTYHHSDDKEEERKTKDALAKLLATRLAKLVDIQRFASLLRTFGVADNELFDLFFQSGLQNTETVFGETPQSEQLSQSEVSIGASVSGDDILGELFSDDLSVDPEPIQLNANVTPHSLAKAQDQAGWRAQKVLQFWIEEKLRRTAEDIELQKYYGMSPDEFGKFVDEIVKGAERIKIESTIAENLREASAYSDIKRDKLMWKQASRASVVINSFLDWLGYDPSQYSEVERRLVMGGKELVVFQTSRCAIDGVPKLGEQPALYERVYCRDWMGSYIDLIRKNVDFNGTQTINVEENGKLAEIIKGFGN